MAGRAAVPAVRPGPALPARGHPANGQPAFGIYVHDPHSAVLHAIGLMVIALSGRQVSAITRFDNPVLAKLARFGLPRSLDA